MAKSPIISRRAFAIGVTAAFSLHLGAQADPVLGDDGNYIQDWYLQSFLDLAEDTEAAASRGKHFAVQWGQRGCSSCKKLHTDYFADATIESVVKNRFDIVHLDTYGSRETVDLDGGRRTEKALAAHHGVRATPTIEFYALIDGKPREVARMRGLLTKSDFIQMFRFVDQRAYGSSSFDAWLRSQSSG